MSEILRVNNLTKSYADGFQALKGINLSIRAGEVFALLGPNGAGKTTLINIICGTVNATSGTVTVDGHDHVADYKKARSVVSLVPQELYLDIFQTVEDTLRIARGLFGKPYDAALTKQVLTDLALWDKRTNKVQELSGGMKRRVLIGKALMNEPKILFLDEPTAGVDVELRRGMWTLVEQLKARGTTVILTTHYIEEAEDLADRIGIIQDGDIKLVEDKSALMTTLGTKELAITLTSPLTQIPVALTSYALTLSDDGTVLRYTYKADGNTGITALLSDLKAAGITLQDVSTSQTSLEDIFVNLTTY